MTTLAAHTGPIDRLEVRYHLDPALSDAREATAWHHDYPATRAGLALALDRRDYECLRLRGSYGAARAYLVAMMGDGEVAIDDTDENAISEHRAQELLTSDGELNPADVHGLRRAVWDGRNHVPFLPARALRWLSGDDAYQRMGHALVRWNDGGGVDDVIIDDGWDIADEYWGTLGNEGWSHGQMDCDAREAALDAADISYDTVWLSDDDVMILVPTADAENARLTMAAASPAN